VLARVGSYLEQCGGGNRKPNDSTHQLRTTILRCRMPFKSRAQRRKFAELLVKGEISPETFEEWNRETGSATLPEHVKNPAKARKKASTRARKKSVKAKPRRKARPKS
jgi:hypothetical protein